MIIPTSSQDAAIAMSRALFRLARPQDSTGDVARYYCGWMTHPTTGQHAINLPTMPIASSPDADPHALDAIFQPFVDGGQMDAAELAALLAAIVANRGGRIVPVAFLALLPSFAAQALTDEQAEAAGNGKSNGLILRRRRQRCIRASQITIAAYPPTTSASSSCPRHLTPTPA